MKLLIIVALCVAAASSSPVSHTLEVGSNGLVGTSAGSVLSPLISLVINIGKGLGSLVAIEGLPETPAPVDPVIVVDHPAVPSPGGSPAIVPPVVVPDLPIGGTPAVVEPVIIPESPAVVSPPQVPDIVVPEVPEGVAVVDPIVLPENPTVVAPEVPEPVQVIEGVNPAPESPEPGQVVDGINPAPESPEPVQVVDGVNPVPAPATVPDSEDSTTNVTNNFLINVLLNFIMGKDGTPSFSSALPDISSLPPGLQQFFGPTPRAA